MSDPAESVSTTTPALPPSSVSLYDARPFFEKALQYGVQNGIINEEKIEAIHTEAPKGIVQIARHFGSEFLRPELEKARERIVNLVSLYLESSTGGDLRKAAESLRDHSFLSRSKGGSDMLKALIAMPQSTSFEADLPTGNELAEWSLKNLAAYQAELAVRSAHSRRIEAALWLAAQMDLDDDALEGAGNPDMKDAESVIRSALLAMAAGRKKIPDWPEFQKMVAALRKKKPADILTRVPARLPAHLRVDVEELRQSVIADLPKILDAARPVPQLFKAMSGASSPVLLGRYYWVEDAMSELADFERSVSKAWDKATGGQTDEGALLTLFTCMAAGAPGKTLLTEKSATSLVCKIQKTGFKPELVTQWIAGNAPAQYRDDYLELWQDFIEEAEPVLTSDAVMALEDSLSLLRRECSVK
ncbi:MAG: hypothetical protein V4614_17785 [Pseudomonadota bacterium]